MHYPVLKRWRLGLAILVLLFGPLALAQIDSRPVDDSASALPSDIPITQWLGGPVRQDLRWRVQVHRPWLTFHQRFIEQVVVSMRVRDLLNAGISSLDFHLIVRLADDHGNWLPGHSHSNLATDIRQHPAASVFGFANFYVRPGNYRISVMGYDREHKRGNVWHGALTVPRPQDDPLPQADAQFPAVEFLPSIDPTSPGKSISSFDPWTVGLRKATLPVENDRPVQIDILVNTALSNETNRRYSEAPDWQYSMNAAGLFQVGYLLSQIQLKSGCIRLSAFDVMRQKIFLDRVDSRAIEWDRFSESIRGLNRSKIEATTLASRMNTPGILATQVNNLLRTPSECTTGSAAPVHILIVVSDAFIFPDHAQRAQVEPFPGLARCYYLRAVPVVGVRWDQIEGILKPLRPVRMDFSDSLHFRRTLAALLADIQKTAANGH